MKRLSLILAAAIGATPAPANADPSEFKFLGEFEGFTSGQPAMDGQHGYIVIDCKQQTVLIQTHYYVPKPIYQLSRMQRREDAPSRDVTYHDYTHSYPSVLLGEKRTPIVAGILAERQGMDLRLPDAWENAAEISNAEDIIRAHAHERCKPINVVASATVGFFYK